jgi:hypothetical protein
MIRCAPGAAVLFAASITAACGAAPQPDASAGAAGLLYVWTGDADAADADFLAVFDVDPASERYGELLETVPVDGRGNWPHHTEYALESAGTLYANAWGSGRTFVFDVADARRPRVSHVFGESGGYAYPHSFARLPNGNVLATFQTQPGSYAPPGGIVELDARGNAVRAVSGAHPSLPTRETWPYSLLVLPEIDRLVTTNTRMGMVTEWFDTTHVHADADARSPFVQVWRLSDLSPVALLELPPQQGGHNAWPAEPRRLANGDVYVNTFSCGLYRLVDLEGTTPRVEPVLRSPFEEPGYCAVPVVFGNFWVHPSATENAIIAYDLSDRARPREVSRVELGEAFAGPHWLALDPGAPRIAATSDAAGWMLLLDIDPATGALSIDQRFRDAGAAQPGISFRRDTWPHGAGGRAMPHGAVFVPRR